MVFRRIISCSVSFSCLVLGLACCASSGKAETVLLDFSSPTCGPCQQMRPVVNRLAAAGHRVREIDISREPQVAAQYGVNQVPTFIVLAEGREVARSVGTTSYEQLLRMVSAAKPAPPRRRAIPQGQSPRTFATPVAATRAPVAPANDLSTPQPGRIIELEGPPSVSSRPPANAVTANPFQQQPIARQPSAQAGSLTHQQRLIEATVKVAVKDADGTSAGTGTIVDARSGEALVLTCGHLFRSSAGKGPITVTLFQAGPTGAEVRGTATGRLIDYDLERDLALVSIRPETSVRPIRIAQPGTPLAPGAAVTTVGCNNGQNATAIASQITAINRYQGPPNVEVAGAPVEGRSGGGLFNANAELIGVCFAADPQSNEGLYSSLPSIHAKLDSLGLGMVYQAPSAESTASTGSSPPSVSQVAAVSDPSFAVRGQEPLAPSAPPQAPKPAPMASSNVAASSLSATEQAALEEIQRRGADSEVICIIRPRTPGGKSDVITLSNASPEFVQALTQQTTASAPATAPNAVR